MWGRKISEGWRMLKIDKRIGSKQETCVQNERNCLHFGCMMLAVGFEPVYIYLFQKDRTEDTLHEAYGQEESQRFVEVG